MPGIRTGNTNTALKDDAELKHYAALAKRQSGGHSKYKQSSAHMNAYGAKAMADNGRYGSGAYFKHGRASEAAAIQTGAVYDAGTNARAGQMNHRDIAAQPQRQLRAYYDFSLLSTLIFIFAIGLLIIYSSSQYVARNEHGDAAFYFTRQLMIGGAGLLCAIVMSLFDYRLLFGPLSRIAYIGAVGLLVMTQLVGLASNGKTRWLALAGNSFQPTELAKFCLILFLSTLIAKAGTSINRSYKFKRVILFTLIPAVLIGSQNISSGVIVIMIGAVMLFVAMDNYKVFMGLLAAALAGIIGLKPLLHEIIVSNGITARPENYILRRIFGWAAPEVFTTDAYQTQQAIYAVGSGGLFGHGFGESIQKYGSIPEIQNDMIFSVVCEEFGFIGAAALIILYLYLLYRIYNIAVNAPDLFGSMICTGVMAHVGLQVALNIAVVTGAIPNTGVTLPFISYGGSAVLFTMWEMGLVLSVSHRIRV